MQCFIPAGKKSDPVKKKGFEQIFGMGEKPGEEFAALNVLHQVEHGKPLHTLMAPEFRPMWIDMDARYKSAKASQEKVAFWAEKNKKSAERKVKAAKNAESATISISTASRDAIDDALQGAMAKPELAIGGSGSMIGGSASASQSSKVKAKLVAFGFSPLDASSAAERFTDVNDALDYLCLNLDEAELPASFAPPGDIEVVQFHKVGSSSGSMRPNAVHAEQLCARLCVSRLAAEKALRAADGSTCGALGVLFRSFTNSRFRGFQSGEEDERLLRQAKSSALEEREMEQEAVEAIYGDDVKVGVGLLKDYPNAWAVRLSMGSGIPGLAIRGPVDFCVVDVDGLYPLTPPAVFIGPGDEKTSRARRRAAMRAAAAEIESLRGDFGTELSSLEPVTVIHSVVSLLAESSEQDLLASAASSRPSTNVPKASGSATTGKVSSVAQYSRKSERSQMHRKGSQPPRWRTPRPVPESRANPRALEAMSTKRQKLPASKSRRDIIDVVKRNQVTVVSGATGSGKTTQVPQFLLEDARESGEPISIVCTQPRRIAAMSVAERVAAERCEKIGQSVGYQVKLNRKKSDDTRLVFCTTGVLLRQMQSDPELDGLTHILVDEVHERSVDTDFVLLLIRDILPRRPSLRVVLMSATLDASKFSSYFSSFINAPVPVMAIPGRTFPVTEYFLEDAVALTRYRLKEGDRYSKKKWIGGRQVTEPSLRSGGTGSIRGGTSSNSATLTLARLESGGGDEDIPEDWEDTDTGSGPGESSSGSYGASLGENSRVEEENKATAKLIDDSLVNVDIIEALVCKLDSESDDQSAGAILIFLPGMAEISSVVERLSRGRGSSRLFVMPLHSAVSPDAQKAIFGPAPKGRRKVICSTNIAETSLTVEDVTIVIDTGRVKEMSYDALNRTSVLAETFISQAAARQRSGRAGRVSKGTCYRLVRKATFEHTFQAQQEPEIRRIALEHLVLNLLSITPSGSPARDPQLFLEKALDPPSVEAVAVAVWNLTALGALEATGVTNGSDGSTKLSTGGAVSLTALGRHLSCLPVDARIGKLLIYGTLFGCQDASLTIAATLSERSPFFSPRDKRDEARRVREKFKWGQSDLLMFVRIFEAWEDVKSSGFRAQAEFCDANFLSRKTLIAIGDARVQLRGQLTDAGFGSDMNGGGGEGLKSNNSDARVVRGVVCAALYPNVLRVDTPELKYEQKRGGAVAKETFNSKDIKLRSKPDRRNGGRDIPLSSGERAFLHPESINFDEGNYGSRWLAFFSKVKTSRVFVRDATMVSPYAILLFGGDIEVRHEQGQLLVDGWMLFKAPARVAVLVRELRRNLDSMLLRKFANPDVDVVEDVQSRAVSDAILRLIREESR